MKTKNSNPGCAGCCALGCALMIVALLAGFLAASVILLTS